MKTNHFLRVFTFTTFVFFPLSSPFFNCRFSHLYLVVEYTKYYSGEEKILCPEDKYEKKHRKQKLELHWAHLLQIYTAIEAKKERMKNKITEEKMKSLARNQCNIGHAIINIDARCIDLLIVSISMQKM